MTCRHLLLLGAVALLTSLAARAEPAPFDLAGPSLEVQVTRGAVTLPIAAVPNLAAGDRLWLRPVPADTQATRYLMVVAFLRGSTDPPPANWFFRCETWSGACAREGLTLTVPKEATQVLIFLAPHTGGDYKTLVDAVRGRPGIFVRTSQELNQAALEHLRLQAYLAAVRGLGESDPARLKTAAPLLARSLAIKFDEKCLDRIPALQSACLMQGRESLIMTDGQSASVAQQLTSGAAGDLAMEAVNTPQLKSGYYGPFIGSLMDIARLVDSFHTAHYQYIPALTAAHGRTLRLTLNAAPSFHDPKSVLVATLPAIGPVQLPPLRAVDPKQSYCARQTPLVLQMEGAPLAFAGDYAHDLTLRVAAPGGATIVLPASPDPAHGGFAIDTAQITQATVAAGARATLTGQWGFDRYEGPVFHLLEPGTASWQLAAGDDAALIVGREDAVQLRGGNARCVEAVALTDAARPLLQLEWKVVADDTLELKLPLQEATPGDVTLSIHHYGGGTPQRLALRAYAEAGHLETFVLHAGDTQGVLRGKRLDEVATLAINGTEFLPGALSSSDGSDELTMLAATPGMAAGFAPGEPAQARVTLKDGRALTTRALIEAPRPSALLIARSARLAPGRPGANIQLAGGDELPQDATLTFSVRAEAPAVFAHDEKIEVATADGSASAALDFAGGAVILQNARVAVATLDPATALGASAFGPIRFRRIAHGIAGDWRPLATLVRLPALTALRCDVEGADGCVLAGNDLFLLDSVSDDAQFARSTGVPDGFTGVDLQVPRPIDGRLYLKLRDDPGVISVATLEPPTGAAAKQPPEPTQIPAQTSAGAGAGHAM
jgi:hypothetical protein